MPKSVEIAEFSTKLGLVAKRLNWSGTKLAQEVGVDKSIAARWLNDRSRPTANNLMQLTLAVGRAVSGFTNADWDLPLGEFGKRLGLDSAALARSAGARDRLTLGGLKFPPVADWGTPYLGLWAGFYQSVTNGGRPLLCACRFAIDDLGFRFSFNQGDFAGEGLAIASRSHVQCLIDVAPLFDRLALFIFNGVRAPRAFAIDGIVSVMAGDSTGTPTASPICIFRIDHDVALEVADIAALSGAIQQVNRRARDEHDSSGDPLAVMSEFVPVHVLHRLMPQVGSARRDGAIDHVLRIPVERSVASGSTGDANRPVTEAFLTEVATKLRRALGLERARPHLRVLN